MDPRLHSASHSLQATPNSTIHSLGVPTHPRLADLWGGVQLGGVPLDAHQVTHLARSLPLLERFWP